MNRNHLLIYILTGAVLFAVLILVTALRMDVPFWDEEYYLVNVGLLQKYGLSVEFAKQYMGPAGPTFAFVHFLFEPITKLEAPLVRLVNVLLLAGTFLFIFKSFRLMHYSALISAAFTVSALAFSNVFQITGLVLTEVPAFFFLSITTYLIISHYLKNQFNFSMAVVAGLCLSLAILGRQPILVFMLAVPVFFIQPKKIFQFNFEKKEFLKFIVTAVVVSLIIPGWFFSIWGNIQPVSQAFTGDGLAPNHFILAFGYAAIFTVLVNPHFFKLQEFSNHKLETLIVVVISALLNILWMKVEFGPFATLAEIYLPASLMQAYKIACGSFLAVIGFTFLYFFLKKQFLAGDPLVLFLSVAFVLIIATSLKVTHQFSTRYVAQAIPLLILAVNIHREKINWVSIVTLLIGGVLGLLSLESYFV